MKKLFVIISFVLMAAISQAQAVKGFKSADGYNAGGKNISNAEFSVLDSAKTGVPIQRQIDKKVGVSSIVDYSATLYTKAQVNEKLAQTDRNGLLEVLKAQGSTVKSIPAAATNIWYGSQAMTDGRAYHATHTITDTITVTGVAYALQTQGSFNSNTDFNGFFLCKVVGANNEVIAQTENDATIWKKVAGVYSTKAFTAPVVLPPGVYKVFGTWNTSDASPAAVPAFYSAQGGGVSTIYNSMLTNGHKFEGYITGSTTSVPAAPFASSTITGLGVSPSFLLY